MADPPATPQRTVQLYSLVNRGGEARIADQSRSAISALRVPNDASLHLVTVFGPARCGKSFLCSALARQDNLFASASSDSPCTAGVDVAAPCRSVNEAFGAGANDSYVCLADCEGQGVENKMYDTMLMTPLVSLSRVLIFCWRGMVNRNTIIDNLAALNRAAAKIGRGAGGDSRFGHLFIVLRDNMGREQPLMEVEAAEANVYRMLFDERDGAEAREASYLLDSFETVNVFKLPRPHEDIDERVVPRDEVRCVFRNRIEQLRAAIAAKLYSPPLFGGRPITARLLREVLPKILECTEKNRTIMPDNITRQLIRREVEEAEAAARARYDERAGSLAADGYSLALRQSTQALRDDLRVFVGSVVAEFVTAAARSALVPEDDGEVRRPAEALRAGLMHLAEVLVEKAENEAHQRGIAARSRGGAVIAKVGDATIARIKEAALPVEELDGSYRAMVRAAAAALTDAFGASDESRKVSAKEALDAAVHSADLHVCNMNAAKHLIDHQRTLAEQARAQCEAAKRELLKRDQQIRDIEESNERLRFDVESAKAAAAARDDGFFLGRDCCSVVDAWKALLSLRFR